MALKWNSVNGEVLEDGTTVVCPNTNSIAGANVVYIDTTKGNDVASNRGCQEVPYATVQAAINDYGGYHSLTNYVIARGVYSESLTPLSDAQPIYLFADSFWTVEFRGDGANKFKNTYRNDFQTYDCVINNYFDLSDYPSNTAGFSFINCFINVSQYRGMFSAAGIYFNKCIVNAAGYSGFSTNKTYAKDTIFYNSSNYTGRGVLGAGNNIYINENTDFENTVAHLTTDTHIFWGGTITYNSITYDIGASIGLGKNEATIISEIETAFSLGVGAFTGRIIEPKFVNPLSGNLNLDYENFPSEVNDFISVMNSQGIAPIVSKGLKLNWDADFIQSAQADPNDGFSGSLYSRNINANGEIIDVGKPGIYVSKKYQPSEPFIFDSLNFFNKINNSDEGDPNAVVQASDVPDKLEFYLAVVPSGTLEDEFNSSNYSFSVDSITGELTCDFPRYNYGDEMLCNTVSDEIDGIVENGSKDIDGGRLVYSTIGMEFRFIIVIRQ